MKQEQKNSNMGIMIIAVIVIAGVLTATNVLISLNKYSESGRGGASGTGYAGSAGYVNISVATVVSVNFTTDTVNWGAGSISNGEQNSSLSTTGSAGGTPTVERGNWSTTGVSALVLQNIGTINASLTLSGGDNAETLFGGSAANRKYAFNVTNNLTGSCSPTPAEDANSNLTLWKDVDTTGVLFCNQFGFLAGQNELRVDLWLAVPYDGQIGALSNTLTTTADTAI